MNGTEALFSRYREEDGHLLTFHYSTKEYQSREELWYPHCVAVYEIGWVVVLRFSSHCSLPHQ